MRALACTSFDGPDRLHFADVPEPESSGKVLIEVAAAGLGFPDLLVSRGGYQVRPELPYVLGMEVAGRVLEAPDAGWVGRRVMALTGVTGGCAERVAVSPELVHRVNDALPTDVAGGFLVNFHTAWFSLVTRAALLPQETVLVHGAGGGLGQAVCHVASALGARVAAVVSTEEKASAARRAGAGIVVLTDGPGGADWPARVRAQVGAVDLVVDPVGGPRVHESLRLLAPLGRLVVVGFTSGEIASVGAGRLLLGNVSLLGAAWREYVASDPAYSTEVARRLDELIDAGRLRPSVGRVYDWDDATSAVADLAEGRVLGRAVIRAPQVGPSSPPCSALRGGEGSGAPVASSVDGPDPEEHVVLGEIDPGAGRRADVDDVRPVVLGRGAPHHLVAGGTGRPVPDQLRVVGQLGGRHPDVRGSAGRSGQ